MATFRRRGTKWQVQVRRTGFESQTRTFQMRTDAEAWARKIERDLDTSSWNPTPVCPYATVREVLMDYERRTLPYKQSAYVEKYILKQLSNAPFASKAPDSLSHLDIAKYRDQRLAHVSPSTVRRELTLLQAVVRKSRDEWGAGFSLEVISRVRKPRESLPRDRRVSDSEISKLIKVSKSSGSKWLAIAIELALETAMRRGEILRMLPSHIDHDAKLLTIPITKNNHPRTIPLSKRARELATMWARKQSTEPISQNGFNAAWQRLSRSCDITNLRFHDLRHEAISRFFELGLSVPEVALISGHRDFRMVARYTHLKPETIVSKLGETAANSANR